MINQRDNAQTFSDVERKCTICGCSDSKPCPGGCVWASRNPVICTACVIKAVSNMTPDPRMTMSIATHFGGARSVRCDGDGAIDMMREHSSECDGFLYPDDTYVEAHYALSGTMDDPTSAIVTMRHCLACFAEFHLAAGQSASSSASASNDSPKA